MFPNSYVSTAAIFDRPAAFYRALELGEEHFKSTGSEPQWPKPADCKTARALGLKVHGSCVVRGPHVMHGYDDVIHGIVKTFQNFNGYDIVIVEVPTRDAQKGGGAPLTHVVERRFLMQWDEVGTEEVEMKLTTSEILYTMLWNRVHLVPLLTRLINKKDNTVADRIVWFPATFDSRAEKREDQEYLAMTFVHITPERIGRQRQRDDLPMVSTSIHWSHRHSVRRYADAYGQVFATDVFQTHYFARPPRAVLNDLLTKPNYLPVDPPGSTGVRTPIRPHQRLGGLQAKARADDDLVALEKLRAESFVYRCPCVPSLAEPSETGHCVYYNW
ncbi:hypothetical protein PsYK624_063200 [Phanerochaete sordida]|uniref:Uncharacterized protein n=1 Tax=Phanerochaete sordida TaxID=48140 RepID=A0A9P3G9B3_9APHY|nr:hypothetical protein PsYK624_063200 [Phanerochaete sordida]